MPAVETPVVEQVEWNGSPPPPGRRLAEILFRESETDGLGSQLERVRDQVDRLEALVRGLEDPAVETPGRDGHVLFLPADGAYALRDGEGEAPAPGDHVGGLVVVRLGASPFPGDRRVCAFLEPDTSGSVAAGD